MGLDEEVGYSLDMPRPSSSAVVVLALADSMHVVPYTTFPSVFLDCVVARGITLLKGSAIGYIASSHQSLFKFISY